MRTRITGILVGFAAVLTIFVAADSASAQRREARGRPVTKPQVKAIINRVETRVDAFVKQFDKALDRSRLDGSNREDWLNKRAKDLEVATDTMRKRFDASDRWSDNKDEVVRCLAIARDIDQNMRNNRYNAATEANWANVRRELNTLADVYNVARV